ncbi:hypothetical protein [uncultured Corynebacterium sp.]|uniref:hypothetical protein n=1 Tax=uncultured Corynebacterium sp. TaxID=159447 RepID=UPI0025E2199F|nr:hypothetical protein [uncultured Corynebacterium sp.]
MTFEDDNQEPDNHDDRDDAQGHDPGHDPDKDQRDQPTDPPPGKRWVTQRDDDDLTGLSRTRNLADLNMALACTPTGDKDVDSHAATITTRIGAGKTQALQYCDVGLMLARMPKLLDFCRTGALPLYHLTKVAAAVTAVSDDNIAEVETRILAYLTPRRDLQALPGARLLRKEIGAIVEDIEPISTPPDEDDEPKPPSGESYYVDNEHPGEHGEMHAILRKDRMAEFDATVRAIRDAKTNAGQQCSFGDALMHMCRGTADGVKVTMNIYADADATLDSNGDGDGTNGGGKRLRLWLDGAGWLPDYLTKQWLERADNARLSSDSATTGYAPTSAQKARVRGRDGGCRFPGCTVPAHRCQIDHVINYDPSAPVNPLFKANAGKNSTNTTSGSTENTTKTTNAATSTRHPAGLSAYLDWLTGTGTAKATPGMNTPNGFLPGNDPQGRGITATWNLQCLCQHHHNLKTSRHWRATMHDDGSVTWTDHEGTASATTVPYGPMAHIKRQTFDQRATRITATIRGNNTRRLRAEAEAAAAQELAEDEAAIREHARATARFESDMAEFIAGPLNSDDPDVAEQAQCLVDAADDGWPTTDDPMWARSESRASSRMGRGSTPKCHRADIDAVAAPKPPQPLGPIPGIPF